MKFKDNKNVLPADNTVIAWVARVKALKASKIAANGKGHDAALRVILQKFNLEHQLEFISEKAFVRLIERTLAVIDKGV